MQKPPGWAFTCFIRHKGQPDSKWRDVRAISAWTTGDMNFGVECVRNETLRRFVSVGARSGQLFEVRVGTASKECVREMRVGLYKDRGSNKAPEGWMRFEFLPAAPPKSPRFVTVKMISD